MEQNKNRENIIVNREEQNEFMEINTVKRVEEDNRDNFMENLKDFAELVGSDKDYSEDDIDNLNINDDVDIDDEEELNDLEKIEVQQYLEQRKLEVDKMTENAFLMRI